MFHCHLGLSGIPVLWLPPLDSCFACGGIPPKCVNSSRKDAGNDHGTIRGSGLGAKSRDAGRHRMTQLGAQLYLRFTERAGGPRADLNVSDEEHDRRSGNQAFDFNLQFALPVVVPRIPFCLAAGAPERAIQWRGKVDNNADTVRARS